MSSEKGIFFFAGRCSPYSHRKGAIHQRSWLGKRAYMKMFAAIIYKVQLYLSINNTFFPQMNVVTQRGFIPVDERMQVMDADGNAVC
jgi:hypothetical protein